MHLFWVDKCPVSYALEGLPLKAGPCLPVGRKGHNVKGKYLAGKFRPLGRVASLFDALILEGHPSSKRDVPV